VFQHDSHAPYLLKEVRDGDGLHTFTWSPLVNNGVYNHPTPVEGDRGFNYLQRGMWVVSSYESSAPPELDLRRETYTYQSASVDLRGRGFRGFERINHQDLSSGVFDTTAFVFKDLASRISSYQSRAPLADGR